ncbi:hypothetical protein RMSM_01801 [Rhodopirellula maiorica SM1]|uniref:Uncharacterized protein n=1 Tax=Rhodopirellula maiorica SM1 TaxID=1265738 RepID=M5RPP8_9BACT|nr:hypothetical protein RMSM_01801 [Rhodopirellula maiorica SM1]
MFLRCDLFFEPSEGSAQADIPRLVSVIVLAVSQGELKKLN